MTNRLITAAFLVAALFASVRTEARVRPARGEVIPSRQPQTAAGTIESFSDGDTYWLKRADGSRVKVREWVADSPEISHAKVQVDQPGGREALDYATKHWKGKEVTVTIKGHSYDRIVGETVAKGETRAIGLDLVATGNAAVYPKATPRPTAAFKEAEATAKLNRLGIWKEERPVMPWDYRAQQRIAHRETGSSAPGRP